MLRFRAWNERIRENLWFWPIVTGFASVVAAVLAARVGSLDDSPIDGLLASPDPDQARALLATLLGSIIAAASIVSTLTIVALQTASTQFSPRLLPNFLRDGATQAVLALFVGTSGFLVTLIVEARDTTPRLAVTIALGLVFATAIVITWFFNHVSQSIRVDWIMRTVTEETRHAADRLDHWLAEGSPVGRATQSNPAGRTPVPATRSGYVQQIDASALCRFATEHGVVVHVALQVGQPVIQGAPIAWWSRPGTAPSCAAPDDIARKIRGSLEIGYERTWHHDVGLGIRQLVDMSIKAMSPAVNDPYTAMQAVDHLGSILVRLLEVPLGDHEWGSGRPDAQVVVPVATFGEFASLACDQLCRYGSREPAVLQRMMTMLRDVASSAGEEQRVDLRRLVENCGDAGRSSLDLERDRHQVDELLHEVLDWFDHDVPLSKATRNGL